MNDYVLSCCSTADLTREQFAEYGVEFVCYHFEIDGKQYPDDLGVSMDFKEFYQAMVDGAMTKTSQVSVGEYTEYFKKFLDEGKDILHLTLSTGISGTYNSAVIAMNDLKEEYPDRKIYVVDSLCASGGFGLIMKTLSEKKQAGMSVDELYKWAEEYKYNLQHWFFTSDLTYLVRGGRVSKASGFIGGKLNICPLLNVNFEGKLINRMKVRGKSKVMVEQVNKMVEYAKDGTEYDGDCIITHSDCYEDARAVADMIEEKFPKLKGKIIINYIGTTIGSHTGPGTVALFFWGDKRVD